MLQGIGIVEASNECEELVERMILFSCETYLGWLYTIHIAMKRKSDELVVFSFSQCCTYTILIIDSNVFPL